MSIVVFSEASAATAVGTDLMASSPQNRYKFDPRVRYVRRIGVTGSSAVGNAKIDLFYGQTLIGTFANTTSGASTPIEAKDILPVVSDLGLAPNEPLIVQINTASATTVLTIYLEIVEM